MSATATAATSYIEDRLAQLINKLAQYSPAIQPGLIMGLLANTPVKEAIILWVLAAADDSDSLGKGDLAAEANFWDCVVSIIAFALVFATLIPESKKVSQQGSWVGWGGWFVLLKTTTTALFTGISIATLMNASDWANRFIVAGNLSFTTLLASFSTASGSELYSNSSTTSENRAPSRSSYTRSLLSFLANFAATCSATGVDATLLLGFAKTNLGFSIATAALFLPITAIEVAKIKAENRADRAYDDDDTALFADSEGEEKRPLLPKESHDLMVNEVPADRDLEDPFAEEKEGWSAWFYRKASETADATTQFTRQSVEVVADAMKSCTVICGS